MSWFDKLPVVGRKLPKGVEAWVECRSCKEQIYQIDLMDNLRVCPKCDYHFRMTYSDRIQLLINPGTFEELDGNLTSGDPIRFKDKKRYKDRIKTLLKQRNSSDSVISGTGMLGDHPLELCVFDFEFLGGSMGSVVGEKLTRAIERAETNRSALVIVSCSGGARMQEGILSLMQMAKTSAALKSLSDARVPYISVLTDPTMGGVSASFAMLGDAILAEPGALIGFAGPRVIEQTIKQTLPEGFQRSEFLLEHGLIDQVVHRKDLKQRIADLLSLYKNIPIVPPRN
ncbi:acetyl-CoA carboxylase, carboxyltransferase subunit beta [Nitrospina watsonii]|uniref:Acetyl-coenzyme A carboxylase carboxyl transferase subunit beta n=1 Tax=Nitrospina watsonii TaxID=1323948 RepID=A0ABM9HDF8_9BACT|nr:acetyl-CoA carboxylase, carboxyltransferase subunit beta [Nitrospina watsonii]CAI2718142.1 Acetyl-coenzyme A carboxylase carboxyl transferase subunit beta [Nitrospina watsonii]